MLSLVGLFLLSYTWVAFPDSHMLVSGCWSVYGAVRGRWKKEATGLALRVVVVVVVVVVDIKVMIRLTSYGKTHGFERGRLL